MFIYLVQIILAYSHYSLSIFFWSLVLLLSFSFPPPPPTVYPLHWRNNHPTAAADIKILRGNSCSPSLSSPLFLLLSLYASLFFFLSRSSPLFLFFPSPPSFIGLISTLCLSIFSLSLVLLLSFFNLNLRSY